jgi:hypothetical protein
MSERSHGSAAGARHRLPRVVLPGPEGLALERGELGGFGWTAAGASVPEEVVRERAGARMRECDEAIDLCDVWLGQGPEARSSAERDEILDSRFRYALERRFLEEFLLWTESGESR